MRSRQQRIDRTTNSAVSLVIPTLTKPALVVIYRKARPCGLLILKIVDVHAPRIALRAIIGSAILDLFFLLGKGLRFRDLAIHVGGYH